MTDLQKAMLGLWLLGHKRVQIFSEHGNGVVAFVDDLRNDRYSSSIKLSCDFEPSLNDGKHDILPWLRAQWIEPEVIVKGVSSNGI